MAPPSLRTRTTCSCHALPARRRRNSTASCPCRREAGVDPGTGDSVASPPPSAAFGATGWGRCPLPRFTEVHVPGASPFARRDFRLLLFGQTASQFGSHHRGRGPAAAGRAHAARLAPSTRAAERLRHALVRRDRPARGRLAGPGTAASGAGGRRYRAGARAGGCPRPRLVGTAGHRGAAGRVGGDRPRAGVLRHRLPGLRARAARRGAGPGRQRGPGDRPGDGPVRRTGSRRLAGRTDRGGRRDRRPGRGRRGCGPRSFSPRAWSPPRRCRSGRRSAMPAR